MKLHRINEIKILNLNGKNELFFRFLLKSRAFNLLLLKQIFFGEKKPYLIVKFISLFIQCVHLLY